MEIRFERENKRAAAYDGDILAGRCEFTEPGGFWIITHTIVDKAYGGQGLAGKLLDAVVNAAREENQQIMPVCSYAVKKFNEEGSPYADIRYTGTVNIYGMPTCPDCSVIMEQIEGRTDFKFFDIGAHIRLLKKWLALRDTNPVFDDAKANGKAGVPTFVFRNGAVTLNGEDLGLKGYVPEKPVVTENSEAK